MDGLETLTAIKASSPLVEVIMLAGHAPVELAVDGMKLGAFDFLMNTGDIEVLVDKVRDAVKKEINQEGKTKEVFKQETRAKYEPIYCAWGQFAMVLRGVKRLARQPIFAC